MLREDNREAMRMNSTVVYIRRDLDKLPSAGRPLSQATPPDELYRRRAPLYEKLAGLTVYNNASARETADEIIRRLGL